VYREMREAAQRNRQAAQAAERQGGGLAAFLGVPPSHEATQSHPGRCEIVQGLLSNKTWESPDLGSPGPTMPQEAARLNTPLDMPSSGHGLAAQVGTELAHGDAQTSLGGKQAFWGMHNGSVLAQAVHKRQSCPHAAKICPPPAEHVSSGSGAEAAPEICVQPPSAQPVDAGTATRAPSWIARGRASPAGAAVAASMVTEAAAAAVEQAVQDAVALVALPPQCRRTWDAPPERVGSFAPAEWGHLTHLERSRLRLQAELKELQIANWRQLRAAAAQNRTIVLQQLGGIAEEEHTRKWGKPESIQRARRGSRGGGVWAQPEELEVAACTSTSGICVEGGITPAATLHLAALAPAGSESNVATSGVFAPDGTAHASGHGEGAEARVEADGAEFAALLQDMAHTIETESHDGSTACDDGNDWGDGDDVRAVQHRDDDGDVAALAAVANVPSLGPVAVHPTQGGASDTALMAVDGLAPASAAVAKSLPSDRPISHAGEAGSLHGHVEGLPVARPGAHGPAPLVGALPQAAPANSAKIDGHCLGPSEEACTVDTVEGAGNLDGPSLPPTPHMAHQDQRVCSGAGPVSKYVQGHAEGDLECAALGAAPPLAEATTPDKAMVAQGQFVLAGRTVCSVEPWSHDCLWLPFV
jgi:hypothetical protein